MLVLTRRPGESITIELQTGEQVEVAIQAQKGRRVRLGIDAPSDVTILREEVADRRVSQGEQCPMG